MNKKKISSRSFILFALVSLGALRSQAEVTVVASPNWLFGTAMIGSTAVTIAEVTNEDQYKMALIAERDDAATFIQNGGDPSDALRELIAIERRDATLQGKTDQEVAAQILAKAVTYSEIEPASN